MMKRFLLLAALILPFGAVTAQNTGSGSTSERPRNTPGYFVDEIGLRMAAEVAPEGFITLEDYVLGSGDLLSVEVKGAIPTTWRGLTVNVAGDVVIAGVGAVAVGGLSFLEGEARIREVLKAQFRNAEVRVTLERPKNINVHVTGDVPSPGRYQFPALTRVDAIVLPILTGNPPPLTTSTGDVPEPRYVRQSGGLLELNRNPIVRNESLPFNPDDSDALVNYDLRHIQITDARGGSRVADLVAYLHGGVMDENPVLQDGSQIRIYRNSRGSHRVSISGGVRFPMETVHKDGDTVGSLIRMAGGLTTEADSSAIRIVRRAGEVSNSIAVVSMDQILEPNDRVIVGIRPNFRMNESAWVSGAVLSPGNYPVGSGITTAGELLELSGGLRPNAQGRSAYLERRGSPEERSLDYDLQFQRIRRASDQLDEGIDYLNSEFGLSRRLLFLDATDTATTRRIRLYDGDRLHIPRDDGSVLVFGQVNQTGYYAFRPGKNVSEYVGSAGGFALAADPERIFVIKSGSNAWFKPGDVVLESGDMIFVDRVPFESLTTFRQNQLQERQLQLSRNQFYLSVVATIASLVTTAIIITSR